MGFLHHSVCFQCAYKRNEVVQKVLQTIRYPENDFKLITSNMSEIVFYVHTGSFLFYHSFLPIVTVTVKEHNDVQWIFMTFKLKKCAKAMVVIETIFIIAS